MELNFDFASIRTTEFGVGREEAEGIAYTLISVDERVQAALVDMIEATVRQLNELEPGEAFNPAEKYASRDHVYLPLDSELADAVRELHEATAFATDANGVDKPAEIYSYFVRLTDSRGRRLTALRRAMQFKGILQARLVRFLDDSLRILDDNVFKLDPDFDLVADDKMINVLRPTSFEFLGRLQDAVLASVPVNVAALKADLDFIDFASIEEYASQHSRAARYLASIRAQGCGVGVNRTALRRLCARNGVQVELVKGKLTIPPDRVLDFLEVMDRRRYNIELVAGSPERFKAASRSRIKDA